MVRPGAVRESAVGWVVDDHDDADDVHYVDGRDDDDHDDDDHEQDVAHDVDVDVDIDVYADVDVVVDDDRLAIQVAIP